MRAALARFLRDEWALGIAGAVAIGYAVINLVSALASAALAFATSDGGVRAYAVTVAGHSFVYEAVLSAAGSLVFVAVLFGWLIRRAQE